MPKIEFGVDTSGEKPVYFEKDNDTGFDVQLVEKLFQFFQRLHGQVFDGTGIGLATVERIIHRHDGEVWAESTLGRGAIFYFTLSKRCKSHRSIKLINFLE